MKVNITIPDELYEVYIKKFGVPNAFARMRAAIEAFQGVDKNDRVILIASDDRRAIEAVFQTTIDNSAKLVKLIQNLNVVKLGNVEMSFTADELARIEMQAAFHGRTPDVFTREMVEELKLRMMEKV